MHYIEKCKHGTLVRQCRCHGPKTVRVVACPKTCAPDDPISMTKDELLQKLFALVNELALWIPMHTIQGDAMKKEIHLLNQVRIKNG